MTTELGGIIMLDNKRQYEVTGTIEDFANLFVSDYDLNIEQARHLSVILAYSQSAELEEKEDMVKKDVLYYLNQKDAYGMPLPFSNLKYTISFTDALVETAKDFIEPIGVFVFTGQIELSLLTIILKYLRYLAGSVHKIEEGDCCIYHCIYDALVVDKSYNVRPEEIERKINGEQCAFMDIEKCAYRVGGRCIITLEQIKKVFEHLQSQGVIKPVINGELYTFRN